MAIGEQERDTDPPDAHAVEVQLALPVLDGEGKFNGKFKLSIPLPGTTDTLVVPATLDGTARLHTDGARCIRLEAQGTLGAPLALRMPLAGGLGRLDVETALSGDATLDMGLPGVHGQLQAHLRAVGTLALQLNLPDVNGRVTARCAIGTPLTLSMLLPDGRAKLGVHDSITLETSLRLQQPHGGSVEAAAPIDVRLDGMMLLPSGSGELQATAPIRTLLHLRRLVIAQLHAPLSLAIAIDGAAELTAELPGRGTRLRAHFTARLALAPLVRLLHDEIERQVHVERVEVQPPRLRGAHDLSLPLLIVVRRGMVQARLQVTAQLHIDPRSKQLALRALHAEGLNAAGHAAAWLYINPRLLRNLHDVRLFDPSGTLPPGAQLEALGFKTAGRDELSIQGILVWRHGNANKP